MGTTGQSRASGLRASWTMKAPGSGRGQEGRAVLGMRQQTRQPGAQTPPARFGAPASPLADPRGAATRANDQPPLVATTAPAAASDAVTPHSNGARDRAFRRLFATGVRSSPTPVAFAVREPHSEGRKSP